MTERRIKTKDTSDGVFFYSWFHKSVIGDYTIHILGVAMDTFDIDECAEFLKVNRTTALELAANGNLPGAKIGRAWVFLRDDMVEYLRLTVRNQQRDRQISAISGKSVVSDYIPATIALQSTGKTSRRKAIPTLPELCGQI